MKIKRKIFQRLLTLLLCFAVILSLTLSIGGTGNTASALTSLSYIETLKSGAGSFYILEIVPAAGEGSIGYYIAGQEPCAGWALDASQAAYATDPTTRASKINARFDTLEAAGILSTGDTAPLSETSTSSSCYTEALPWIAHDGYTRQDLDHTETATSVPGTFSLASNGAYIQSNSFTFVPAGTGSYVQVIKYFSKNADTQSGDKYYYTPTFGTVTDDNLPALRSSGTAIYTYNSLSAAYVYTGTLGTSDFPGMELDTTYFYIASYSSPSATQDEASYVAVSAAYRNVNSGESGYFTASSLKYAYVGTGGTYDFTYAAGSSTTNTIEYDTVYYKYNYTNNNWFLKYVLDWSQDELAPKLKVTSVPAQNATVSQVNQADLIVLSNGFVPSGTATSYSSAIDISSSVSTAIIDTVKKNGDTDSICNMPVIMDNSLTSSDTTNLKALVSTLKNTFSGTYGSAYGNYAYNNIFCFSPDTTRTALATGNLCTMYSQSSYSIAGSPFYPVYDIIMYENILRTQKDSSAVTLDEKVNMARAIRYIINFAKQRVKGQKPNLEVLDIEPCDTTSPLSADTVAKWTDNYYSKDNISVTTMSTLELVGKIDDLIESYDLIYVGDNGGIAPSKNDTGYIYANIGKEVQIHSSAIGLTDAEYTSTVFTTVGGKSYYQLKSTPQNSRYSGNDLSAKKLADLNTYAVAGHPVVIAGSLATGSSEPVTFSVTIANTALSSSTAVLTASVAAVSGTLPSSAPTFQWYLNGSAVSGATGSMFTPASAGSYYCKATYTINGTAYASTSNAIVVALKTAITSYPDKQTTGSINGTSFTPEISPSSGIANVPQILTAIPNCSTGTPSYKWYLKSNPGTLIGSTSTYSVTSSGWLLGDSNTFYCKVTITKSSSTASAYSNSVTLTRILALTSNSSTGAVSVTIPAQPVTINTLSGSAIKVDNCSNMYTFLNDNKSRHNVMRTNAIDSQVLLRYINLSKPSINLVSYPAVYTRSGSTALGMTADSDGSYTLKYNFTITNVTDPTPDDTRYYCYLFVDSDLDSRYSDSERLGGLQIHEGSATGAIVNSGELKAGTEYTVTRELSAELDGFIPWKLMVVKVNEETVHASQTNYTYVKPALPEEIDILQINTGRTESQAYGYGWDPRGGLSLDTTLSSVTQTADGAAAARTKILSLFNSISSDYNIKIQTITTTQLNTISSTPITNKLVSNNSGQYSTYSNITNYLNSYDLVFIGFDDCYNELSKQSSFALGNYLRSGHPVFYSHDASSYTNVPQIYVEKASSSNLTSGAQGFFGYYFNKELRSLLGLDRYGITDSIYGHTAKSDEDVTTSGIVASQNYLSLSSAVKQVLLVKDYSIAYTPGTNTSGTGGAPVGTTQGFTDYSFDSGNTYSSTITQINKGQITTYPFNVNSVAFGGSVGNSLSILQTHEQYYQLNMNPDNVVVWYCLDSSEYQNNDAANAYYLFTMGNATYTGFGHCFKSPDGSTFSSSTLENEAKLFVNSLIVAYRITSYKPEIKFTDYRGENTLSTVLLPSDGGSELNITNSTDTSRNIYFTISDMNIGKNKLVSALVSLVDDTENYSSTANKMEVPIYDSLTNKIVTGSLISGSSYYFKIDDILSVLAAKGKTVSDSGTPIYVVSKTTVHGSEYTGSSEITLRKLELFSLS